MHIHANSMSVNPASFYSVANGEKSAAANVRKRLLKGAAAVEGTASPEETLLIGHWLDGQQLDGAQANGQPAQDDSEPHPWSGRDPDFG
jgi:hypothetical protein